MSVGKCTPTRCVLGSVKCVCREVYAYQVCSGCVKCVCREVYFVCFTGFTVACKRDTAVCRLSSGVRQVPDNDGLDPEVLALQKFFV